MSIADFPELRRLSRPEKILLVQQLWDEIAAESDDYPLQPWQKKALEESMAEYRANPHEGAPWSEVKARLIARLQ
ncbi:MAG: addiction module protein [Opitutaceae bacterium]|jgi:putative addiction module component (TIGR02574 family)